MWTRGCRHRYLLFVACLGVSQSVSLVRVICLFRRLLWSVAAKRCVFVFLPGLREVLSCDKILTVILDFQQCHFVVDLQKVRLMC